MNGDKERRVKKLEQAKEDSQVKIIVNWDENPEPPGEGVTVITWDDIEGEPEHETV